ncbi:glutaredoxin [Fulvivirga maritima]|uniref:arsenate reductase family protein n=1 Tax=Fulvivirga maritima TaxID=2904247 RepID=UPI001F1C328D|nr:ArsC/Spx/MgsR family protein [Fulvivirga maritima]UII25560.1 glutaredoxin [Fulvivirga maritima]
MRSFQFHPNELLLIYYDPSTSTSKQTRAYARSVSNNVNELNLSTVKLTTTLWKEIVNRLDLRPKDLLDKSNANYQAKVRGNTFTMTGWLEVLCNNPYLLKAPIAVYHDRAILCRKPTDILRLDVNSRGSFKVPPHLRPRVVN